MRGMELDCLRKVCGERMKVSCMVYDLRCCADKRDTPLRRIQELIARNAVQWLSLYVTALTTALSVHCDPKIVSDETVLLFAISREPHKRVLTGPEIANHGSRCGAISLIGPSLSDKGSFLEMGHLSQPRSAFESQCFILFSTSSSTLPSKFSSQFSILSPPRGVGD